MFPIPNDVIPLIINNLDIRSICSFRQCCKEANNNNFDWHNYFFSKTTIPDTYKNFIIDENFMRIHGLYLMNIKDPNIVKKWFTYYQYINDVLSKYEIFIVEPKYYCFYVSIEYWNGEKFHLTYNKRSGKLEVNVGNYYTAYLQNIKKIICKKLKERILSYHTIRSIDIKMD